MPGVGEWSHYPKGLPCVETINLVDKMWRREEKKDTMLLVMMKQMELLMSYVKGFRAKKSHAFQDYDDGNYGNQGWNSVQFVDTNNQGRTEVLPPHMESTLNVVLEKVLATEEGVQDLRSKLLDLTTKVKSHKVIFQQLEERMNELAVQMVTPIATNNTAPGKEIMDDDVLEWEMEEEAIEELIVDVFLKGEELEKIHHVHKEIEKEAPMIKRARYTGNMTPPSPMASLCIATAPANATKAIPSMIQSTFKKALQPAKDKLTHLCSKVDVLESEVIALQQEVATLTAPNNQLTHCGPEVVPPQVEAPRIPLDDWWLGYHNNVNIVSDEEEDYQRPPPLPQMQSVYDVDPSWAPGGVATTSYHEL
ncbi:hypothetical protein HAX54_033004 [Datura stramonium]|uniref:Uncharacterized protein n=1 Tax=Datura stramonium TaxID=4076 RepID=A0ABS8SD02_DATST|nr:hypothetical protein [Datura stramonium]